MKIVILILLCAAPLFSQDKTNREILDPFTGHWKGTFKVYNYDGKLLDQLEVEQKYWWDGNIQKGAFTDRYPDGRTIRAEAKNYEKNGVLICKVEKENGEKTSHTGRFENGFLFWYRKTEDGNTIESFKEDVVQTPHGREYRIDGFGIYGYGNNASYLLFEGRYHEVK